MIKKKLRDITKKEYSHYVSEHCCSKAACDDCIFNNVVCNAFSDECWINHKNIYSNSFLTQTIEVEGEILTNKEKDFLFSLVELFREFGEVKKIHIKENESSKNLSISIVIENGKIPYSRIILGVLPVLTKNTLFKNMKDKFYTIEELGLK